jgi:hypothetical protein
VLPASSPLILYQGRTRINRTDGSRDFDWEGWQAEVVLTDATYTDMLLSVPSGVTNWFRVFVDSAPTLAVWVNSSCNSYRLFASPLPPGPHNVRIFNTNEPLHSGTSHAPFMDIQPMAMRCLAAPDHTASSS